MFYCVFVVWAVHLITEWILRKFLISVAFKILHVFFLHVCIRGSHVSLPFYAPHRMWGCILDMSSFSRTLYSGFFKNIWSTFLINSSETFWEKITENLWKRAPERTKRARLNFFVFFVSITGKDWAFFRKRYPILDQTISYIIYK